MNFQFQVLKASRIVYSMDFPVDEPWHFSEFLRVAVADFHKQCPSILLFDDDVELKIVKL